MKPKCVPCSTEYSTKKPNSMPCEAIPRTIYQKHFTQIFLKMTKSGKLMRLLGAGFSSRSRKNSMKLFLPTSNLFPRLLRRSLPALTSASPLIDRPSCVIWRPIKLTLRAKGKVENRPVPRLFPHSRWRAQAWTRKGRPRSGLRARIRARTQSSITLTQITKNQLV